MLLINNLKLIINNSEIKTTNAIIFEPQVIYKTFFPPNKCNSNDNLSHIRK